MKKFTFLSILSFLIFVCLLSCQKEEVDIQEVDLIDSTIVQIRSDDCWCAIGSNGDPSTCTVDYTIIPDNCPTGGTWEITLNGDPITPLGNIPNGVTVDNSIEGNYCVTYTIEECSTTRCDCYEDCQFEPCDFCEDCTVSLIKEDCRITAGYSHGCESPVDVNFTLNGNPIGPPVGGWIEMIQNGEYCVEIVDQNGCTSSDCITVDGCEKCDGCDLDLTLDRRGCKINACINGRKCLGPYTYYVSGPYGYFTTSNSLFGCVSIYPPHNGEYCVSSYDSEGCYYVECITVDCVSIE